MEFMFWGTFLMLGLYASWTDSVKRLIYNSTVLMMFLTGIARVAILDYRVIPFLFGAILAFLIFFIPALIWEGQIGGGDIKLAAACGWWFGYPGVLHVLVIFSILFLSVAGVAGVYAFLTGRINVKKYPFPAAPIFFVSSIVYIFLNFSLCGGDQL